MTMKRRMTAVLAVLGLIGGGVVGGASGAAAFPAQCYDISRTYAIQEGSVDVNNAKVYITGRICRGEDGLFNSSASQLQFSMRTTSVASAMGYTYWLRGASKIQGDKTTQKWRVWASNQVCMMKYLPACGPEGQFRFTMTAKILFLSYMGLRRSAITAENVWGEGARWS